MAKLDSYQASHQTLHLRSLSAAGASSGGGEPGNGSERLAASTRIRRNIAFLTRMPHAGQAGSGWRDPALATACKTPSSSGHTPPPPDRRGEPPRQPNLVRQATFMRAPSGSSPVVTYFHKATNSFLARATAVILRMRPWAVPTRWANQRAKALSGW